MASVLTEMSDDMYDFKTDTKGALAKLYKASEILDRITVTSENADGVAGAKADMAKRVTAKAKAEAKLMGIVDSVDVNSAEEFKLGSREDAEALIEFALESSKGYDAVRDAKLMKIATDNDAVDHYKKMKSYYSRTRGCRG